MSNSEGNVVDPSASTRRLPIAVFVGSWLPYSETFIYGQLLRMRRLEPWVFAGPATQFAGRFPFTPVTHRNHLEQVGYRYFGFAPSVDRALERSEARLIYAHFGLNGAFALPFARRHRLPMAVMFHGHDVGGLLPGNRHTLRYYRYQTLAPALFDYASLLLCASEELKTVLAERGAPPSKLRVHRLGIDTSKFRPDSSKPEGAVILMVGRLVEKKGVRYALRAFRNVLARVPEARLRIVGDGPLLSDLRREATRLAIEHRATFVGNLPADGVVAEMQRAHVMLTPSVTTARGDRESGVLVLKEAAAVGLPAVATAHGGIPEIIEDERTGLLVPQRDAVALADALTRVLTDRDFAARLGASARAKVVAEYDERAQTDELESLLAGLAGGALPRPAAEPWLEAPAVS